MDFPMPTDNQDTILEQFDKDFSHVGWIPEHKQNIKDWISKALTLSNKRAVEKERAEIIEIIKKRRGEVNIFSPGTGDKFVNDIVDIISNLTKN